MGHTKSNQPAQCLLIKGRVESGFNYKFIVDQKLAEEQILHLSSNLTFEGPQQLFSTWFYRGSSTGYKAVYEFMRERKSENWPVFVYFSNECFRPSKSETTHCFYSPGTSTVMRISRTGYRDPHGANMLTLQNVSPCLDLLNLADYEIACGIRKGMCAADYFADGKTGSRIAFVRKKAFERQQNFVTLRVSARLLKPWALYVERW